MIYNTTVANKMMMRQGIGIDSVGATPSLGVNVGLAAMRQGVVLA